MPLSWILGIILGLAIVGYFIGRGRALSSVGGDIRALHSLPSYYGQNVSMWTAVPALLVLAIWMIAQPIFVEVQISQLIPETAIREGSSLGLVMAEVRRAAEGLNNAVAAGALSEDLARNARADFTDMTTRLKDAGQIVTSEITQPILRAAQEYRILNASLSLYRDIAVIALAVAGAIFGISQAAGSFRARNVVERFVLVLLMGASTIAILTTLGIFLSLLFETIHFFDLYPAKEFLLGTVWQPSFQDDSTLGVLPLLWGTFYISIIALLVAVPIGLFAAIYLSEYASPAVRGFAKPLIEVLAGIPTIVYGLFALLTVGPLLLGVFGRDGTLGVEWMDGGRAVMTAGLVMGIMLIPFVSSLSDDIINAVPQSMRDGSLGLGATPSETIRQVIIPAALPGIVGAILLAASRAIGETMIVVLGAGAAGKLDLNPFEAMTTVTAKIVSQLTGDSDFASPEALVAFALGMSLFLITLCLNVLALYIVRKYREQYE